MEMEPIWTVALIIFCFGHTFTLAESKTYFVVGKTIELLPPPDTADITSILWKHDANMVAEWAKGDEVDYYGSYKNRAILNTITGRLAIDRATEADAGVYTVEINKTLLEDKYVFASIQEVPKPAIWVKPGAVEDERTLSCDGDASKAEPVTFWWDITEDRSWVKLERRITLKKNATLERMEQFSCKMVNPAGEKESEPHMNPFFRSRGNSGLWALLLLPILLLAGAGVVVFKNWTTIAQRFRPRGQRSGPVPVPVPDADADAIPIPDANANQHVPLKDDSGQRDTGD